VCFTCNRRARFLEYPVDGGSMAEPAHCVSCGRPPDPLNIEHRVIWHSEMEDDDGEDVPQFP